MSADLSPLPDLLVIGNLVVDDLVFDDGRTRMGQAGGAVVYAALGAAIWGVRVGIVSIVGDDYPVATLDALRAQGVDLAGLRAFDGPGLRAWILYEPDVRRFVQRVNRPTHEDATPNPADVPAAWHAARAIHLTPTPLISQAALVDDLARLPHAQLSIDPHTTITTETVGAWQHVLSRCDTLFVSEYETQVPRLEPFLAGRLKSILLKQGERGGCALRARAAPQPWTARASRVVDPTGAGDAFAGGFLAACLGSASLSDALAHAVVSASYAIQDWGAAGLLSATPGLARHRLQEWFPEARQGRQP